MCDRLEGLLYVFGPFALLAAWLLGQAAIMGWNVSLVGAIGLIIPVVAGVVVIISVMTPLRHGRRG